MKHLSIIFLMIFSVFTGYSQQVSKEDREEILRQANTAYFSGKYIEAQKLYNKLWILFGDKDCKLKKDECEKIITLIGEGNEAEKKDDYQLAISKYEQVAKLNPYDHSISKEIDRCKEKNYLPLLEVAQRLYREGQYAEASLKLSEYESLSGKRDSELLTKIIQCQDWAKQASIHKTNKRYASAQEYYNKILAMNPTDAVSAMNLAEVNSLSQTGKSEYKYIPAPKIKKNIFSDNYMNYRFVTSFNQSNVIGLYIGGNRKLFQIGADISICKWYNGDVDTEYYLDYSEFSYLQKNYMIKEPETWRGEEPIYGNQTSGKISEYFAPYCQFVVSPGINLKYVSLECGLGVTVGATYKCYELYNDYYCAEKNIDTKMIVRPTVTGFIPVGDSGCSISVGYNFFMGAESMNSIVFGLGWLWKI